jgi:hypothetical protein
MPTLVQNLRFALRMYRRQPGLTAAALLAIGLGAAGSTVILSVANAILYQPILLPQPGQLVLISSENEAFGASGVPASPADFADYRHGLQGVAVAAFHRTRMVLREGGEPERIRGCQVSEDCFRRLGVPPRLGSAAPLWRGDRAAARLT